MCTTISSCGAALAQQCITQTTPCWYDRLNAFFAPWTCHWTWDHELVGLDLVQPMVQPMPSAHGTKDDLAPLDVPRTRVGDMPTPQPKREGSCLARACPQLRHHTGDGLQASEHGSGECDRILGNPVAIEDVLSVERNGASDKTQSQTLHRGRGLRRGRGGKRIRTADHTGDGKVLLSGRVQICESMASSCK